MRGRILWGAMAVAVVGLSTAQAQDLADLKSSIEQARERLELSEAQTQQLTPIFEVWIEEQAALLEEYGIGSETGRGGQGSNIENIQALQRALRENRAELQAEIATVLSGEQMAEFAALQTEAEERIREAAMARRVQQIGQRIGLDEAQYEPFATVYSNHVNAQMALLEEHGIEFGAERQGRTRLRTLLALRGDLRDADEATLERLSSILTDEQLAEYRAIQDEERERNRQRMR